MYENLSLLTRENKKSNKKLLILFGLIKVLKTCQGSGDGLGSKHGECRCCLSH